MTIKTEEVLSGCHDMLKDHNRNAPKLDIVLFKEAIDNIMSLNCVLSMKRCHAMLVGVKSNGGNKQ